MNPALVVKLRPTGPWRLGADSGARNQVETLFHSDSLYGAVTWAMLRLGRLQEWLDATAHNTGEPAVRLSSCFPFMDDILFVIPPANLWPPPPAAAAGRVRWKSARFIPREMVGDLLAGRAVPEENWHVDAVSQCLLPQGKAGPFRTAVRSNAAVDRLSGVNERHSVACLEFRAGAGWWAMAAFADEEQRDRWSEPVRAAFRLLADSGIGGERSRGWGRSEPPEFGETALPGFILPAEAKGNGTGPEDTPAPSPAAQPLAAYWLLSLYAPAAGEPIEWKQGAYSLLARGGRIESPVRSGDLKKQMNMISEGSVVFAAAALRGTATDVAPDGFPHPVFRCGFALAIPLPAQVMA